MFVLVYLFSSMLMTDILSLLELGFFNNWATKLSWYWHFKDFQI